MAARAKAVPEGVYQLKITLRGSKPPIWRRVVVPGKFNLHQLHRVIQLAVGWRDCHLHQFIIDGEHYSIPSPDDWEPVADERRFTLKRITPGEKFAFKYQYDFGDNWDHSILVEKILPAEAGVQYPACIKGKRACPPEDVGGVWGYETFLEAIADPNHEEHEEMIEWVDGEFDPEELDLEEINLALRRLK